MKLICMVAGMIFLVAPLAFGAKGLPLLDQKPQPIEISGAQGGRVADGKTWQSESMRGQPHLFIYLDPDLADANNHFTQRLKKPDFPSEHMDSVVVINMKASRKPNFLIRKVLASKQREFPDTLYVIDKEKVLVEKWQLLDQAYNILLLDSEGRVVFRRNGVLSSEEIEEFVDLVKVLVAKNAA